MDGMGEVFAKHKMAILLGGAALGVLILLSSSKGSSSSSNAGAAIQSQQIAAQQDVQIANINATAQVANNGYAAAAYAKAVDAATATDANHQQADVAALASVFSFAANKQKVDAAVAVNQSNNDASYASTMASILGAIQINGGNNNTAQAIETGDNNTRIQLNNTNTNAALATLQETLGFENLNLPSLLQHSENLATIGSNTEVNLANIGANRDTNIAQINADASTNNTLTKTGGGLISNLLGLF